MAYPYDSLDPAQFDVSGELNIINIYIRLILIQIIIIIKYDDLTLQEGAKL